MTARFRVLHAMLQRNEFTAADLAKLSGVSLATVRTVIDRERRRLEDVSRLPEERRGGRWQLYRLAPDARQSIETMLASGGELPSADQELPPCPATLIAAEDYLVRQFQDLPKEREQILARERRDLDAARSLIEQSPAHQPYRSRLEILDAIWHIRKDNPDSRHTALHRLVAALAGSKYAELPGMTRLPAPVIEPVVDPADDPQIVVRYWLWLFRNLRDETSAAALIEARISAAKRFRDKAVSHFTEERRDSLVQKLLRRKEVRVGLPNILEIGCDYNSYCDGAVKILEGESGLAIRSFAYIEIHPEPVAAPPDVAPITRAMAVCAGR